MDELTLDRLKPAVRSFVGEFNQKPIRELYGVDNGKTIGTHVEHALHRYLGERYSYIKGSAARGADFPDSEVDLKVTSTKRPQSSSPFRDATQKVYGLGYHLLVLIYSKEDDNELGKAWVTFHHAIFVDRKRTADNQTTLGLREILERNGNKDEVLDFLEERNLPLDASGREALADRILNETPDLGHLTIINALQWRLLHGRPKNLAAEGSTPGIENLLG